MGWNAMKINQLIIDKRIYISWEKTKSLNFLIEIKMYAQFTNWYNKVIMFRYLDFCLDMCIAEQCV